MQESRAAIAQASNLFVFTMNNPVGFTDPSGMVAIPLGIMNGGLGPLQMVSPLLRVMQATINATNQARTMRQTSSSSSTSSGTSGSNSSVGVAAGTGSITQQMRASMAAKPCPAKAYELLKKGGELVWNGSRWVVRETVKAGQTVYHNLVRRPANWIANKVQGGWNAVSGWFSGGASKVPFGEAMLKAGNNVRESLLNTVQHDTLRGIIESAYLKSATIGDGGTAAMLKHEFSQGLVPRHLIKANDLVIRLNNFVLNNIGNIEFNDLFIAEQMKRDLMAAIGLW